MNFNCTDIILALDQTWSNHSSLLHVPKTFSEEIPCQCRFFSEVSRMGKCTDLSLKCHEHGWTRIILITIQILSPKLPWQKKQLQTNQSTAEFWTLEVLRCLNPWLHCISSNWPPEKSWASNGHTLQLHDILRQSGQKNHHRPLVRDPSKFLKKTNQKPKQAGRNHVPVLSEKT